MYSITALAKKSALPRRTVQYWHDRQVIQPINEEPLVYSDSELVLVRILAALTQSKPTVAWIKGMARILRLCIEGDASVPADVAGAFEDAKNGKPAYFGVAPEMVSDGIGIWDWTFGAKGESRLKAAVVERLELKPNLGLTIVDLKYCFDLTKEVGSITEC